MQPIILPARILAAYEKLKTDARIKKMREHTAHGHTSVYAHSIGVTGWKTWSMRPCSMISIYMTITAGGP